METQSSYLLLHLSIQHSLFLITVTSEGSAAYMATGSAKCDEKKKNSAFVFIKPHANTTATQNLVQATLKAKGITVLSEGELSADQIDKGSSV